MSKRLGTMLLTTMIALALVACGGQTDPADGATVEDPMVLVFAHVLDPTHPVHQGAMKMDEILQELSGGTMKLDIYPNSALGDEIPVAEVQASSDTIALSAPSGNAMQTFSNEFYCVDFPFAFENYDQVWAFYDGPMGDFLFQSLEGTGLLGIGWWDNGFRNLTSNKPVHTAADVSGMKIRVMSAEVFLATWDAMGAAATPVAFAEVYSALQQGVVEAQENPIANIYGMKFNEVQEYITFTRHVHDPSPVLMSEKVWGALSQEQQGWVLQACEEAGAYMRQVSVDQEAGKLQEMIDSTGLQVVELTDEERQTFVDATKDVYLEFTDRMSPEGVELYEKTIAEIHEQY